MGVEVSLEKSRRRGEGALSGTRKYPIWGGGIWERVSLAGGVGGIEAAVVRFGASVNKLSKSIDLNRLEINFGPNGMDLTTRECPA
ncbi:hypothetical protein AVEN_193040-1 [Araneus ventricosus]|uniref:Uncharacterized protein n=1 Tax=Araneus ventricosus TaxID=182803 RepID=A0A4Y2N512_ARAVE|nr:hypothetical protein AVEN_193040-1 [Araneus ventricosus]